MPTNAEFRKFLQVEGWKDKDKEAGRPTGDHRRYFLELPNGEVLYTRVSHGPGGIDDPRLFAQILRQQLQVTEEQFWACVRDGRRPPRPGAPQALPERRLDAKLAWNLVKKVGLTHEQVAELDQAQALKHWQQYLEGLGGAGPDGSGQVPNPTN